MPNHPVGSPGDHDTPTALGQLVVRHGLARTYKDGCRCEPCTAAQTEATRLVRQRQRVARTEIEKRLAARLRSAIYHEEPWLQTPRGISREVWENEIARAIRRLERGNATSRRALVRRLGRQEHG